jgi:hypothetical protein
LRIAEILPSHIVELLKPIWIVKRETSNRVRRRIETIIAKNVDINDNGFRNPAELTKQLREKLAKRPKRKPRHHPALPYAETPQFMPELASAEGVIGNTRSDKDFARFLKALLNSAGPDTRWDIVWDNLNIHLSESVVRLVAPLRPQAQTGCQRQVRRARFQEDPRSIPARPDPPRHLPLHPQARLMAQPDRNLVLHPRAQAASPQQLRLKEQVADQDRAVHRLL